MYLRVSSLKHPVTRIFTVVSYLNLKIIIGDNDIHVGIASIK